MDTLDRQRFEDIKEKRFEEIDEDDYLELIDLVHKLEAELVGTQRERDRALGELGYRVDDVEEI
jgi:hypothetical protein